MSKLLNIGQELSKKFLLKSKKDQVWSEYLDSESQYVNGTIYVHRTPTPVYHTQKLKSSIFTVDTTSGTNLKIVLTDGGFSDEQVNKTVCYLNNNLMEYTKIRNTDGVTIIIPFNDKGSLDVIVPAVNTLTDEYQGLSIGYTIQSQGITINKNNSNSSYFNFNITIDNYPINQTFKLSSIFRDNDINFTTTHLLSENDKNNFDIKVTRGEQDVGVRLLLDTYYDSKNKIQYLGREIYIMFE